MQPESKISRAIRVALCRTGRVTVVPNRILAMAYTAQGKPLGAYGLGTGSADLVGILHGLGRVFAIEVKTATGTLRAAQKQWADVTRKRGGFVAVARDVDEALQALARAEAGASE